MTVDYDVWWPLWRNRTLDKEEKDAGVQAWYCMQGRQGRLFSQGNS